MKERRRKSGIGELGTGRKDDRTKEMKDNDGNKRRKGKENQEWKI